MVFYKVELSCPEFENEESGVSRKEGREQARARASMLAERSKTMHQKARATGYTLHHDGRNFDRV